MVRVIWHYVFDFWTRALWVEPSTLLVNAARHSIDREKLAPLVVLLLIAIAVQCVVCTLCTGKLLCCVFVMHRLFRMLSSWSSLAEAHSALVFSSACRCHALLGERCSDFSYSLYPAYSIAFAARGRSYVIYVSRLPPLSGQLIRSWCSPCSAIIQLWFIL